jgi:hypothetical protein
MIVKFESKEEITKINIKRLFVSYKRLEHLMNKLNVKYLKVVTTEKSKGGTLYKVKYNGKEYIGLSTYSRQAKSKKDGRVYFYYTFYLMEPEEFNNLMSIFLEEPPEDILTNQEKEELGTVKQA